MRRNFLKSLQKLDLLELANKFGIEPKGYCTMTIDGTKRVVKVNRPRILFVGVSYGQKYYTTVGGTTQRFIQLAYRNIRRQSLKAIGKYNITDMAFKDEAKGIWSRVNYKND